MADIAIDKIIAFPGNLPEPPVPPNADCRKMSWFRFDVERFIDSELLALATADELRAALLLWCRAWKQLPAGSVPNDDRVLAVFSGAGKRWPKIREMALRGFVKCSDGRLYHLVLCQDVNRSITKQAEFAAYREKEAKRLREWREKRPRNVPETPDETCYETRTKLVRQGQGPGPGPVESKEEGICDPLARETVISTPDPDAGAPDEQPAVPKDQKVRGTRWPQDQQITQEWIADAVEYRKNSGQSPINAQLEASLFVAHFCGPDAQRPVKKDWHRAWLGWVARARAAGPHGQGFSDGDLFGDPRQQQERARREAAKAAMRVPRVVGDVAPVRDDLSRDLGNGTVIEHVPSRSDALGSG